MHLVVLHLSNSACFSIESGIIIEARCLAPHHFQVKDEYYSVQLKIVTAIIGLLWLSVKESSKR